jgi:carboxypeptidase C (cathepsin A)
MRSFVLATAFAAAAAAPAADQVTTLPGFGTPVSPLYSGYLASGPGKHAHYVFSASQDGNANAPVVAWFNGGPGCSSLEGGFSESGPYRIVQFSSPPALIQNPFSWNNFSHNLFIEAPAAVGFSYCDTAAGCQHTDTSTAADNLAALVSFFGTAFPEYASNDFYITGESYAGIYVPSLAHAVWAYNTANPSTALPLKGIAVGNGCIGFAAGHCGNDPTGVNDYHDIQIWRGHGLVSEPLYDAIMGNCTWTNESPQCNSLLQQAANDIGNIDVYFLYNTCNDPAAPRLRAPVGNSLLGRALKAAMARAQAAGLDADANCFGSGPTLEQYFNTPAVKTAFHVAPAITWELCSGNGTFGYNPNIADERKTVYPDLVNSAKINVLIYNGEADLCVPYTDNEWWTRTFAQAQGLAVTSRWQPWNYDGDTGATVGGYVTKYANKFSFATVRDAGHMVPEMRPAAAFSMMKTFIATGTL